MLSAYSSRYAGNIQRGLEGADAPLRGGGSETRPYNPTTVRGTVCRTGCGANCYDAGMLSEAAILQRLRKICLRLPAATEGLSFGHPTFRVEKKIFAVLEEYKGELGICLKVGTLLQGVFLNDPRFFRTPYIGKHGWVTLRAYAAPLNWNEIRELVKCSYDLVAPAKTRPRTKTKRKG